MYIFVRIVKYGDAITESNIIRSAASLIICIDVIFQGFYILFHYFSSVLMDKDDKLIATQADSYSFFIEYFSQAPG